VRGVLKKQEDELGNKTMRGENEGLPKAVVGMGVIYHFVILM